MANFVSTDTGESVTTDAGPRNIDAFGGIRTTSFEPMCGWTFAYNVNPALIATDTDGVTGGVAHAENFAVISTGTDAAGYAQIQTRKASRYIPGVGGLVRFTARFSEPQENSTQLIGLFDDRDGWAVGYHGTKFGLLRRAAGVDNWTYQGAWNVDKFNKLNPQKGNVYQIAYQWLGFGAQTLSIEDTYTAKLMDAHRVSYANLFDSTSIDNPNLPLTARVENDGNTTDMVMRTPSAVAGLDGDAYSDAVSIILSESTTKSLAGGTDEPVITFKNPTTYEGKNNRLFVQALRLSFATDGTKSVVFDVFADAAITGGTYAPINAAISPIEVNDTFTSFTGGAKIGTFALGKTGQEVVDLTGSQFRGFPGEEITIVATGIAANDVIASVTFRQFL